MRPTHTSRSCEALGCSLLYRSIVNSVLHALKTPASELINAESRLSQLPLGAASLGVAASPPQSALGGTLAAANQEARFNEAFFGSLGQAASNLDFGSLFSPSRLPAADFRVGATTALNQPGLRLNFSGR